MEYPVLDVKATGRRICELRRANHLSVEDVSRFMGFQSGQAVYKWQRGESLPTVENLYALSKLFGTTVDDILCGREEDDKSSSSFYRWRVVLEMSRGCSKMKQFSPCHLQSCIYDAFLPRHSCRFAASACNPREICYTTWVQELRSNRAIFVSNEENYLLTFMSKYK